MPLTPNTAWASADNPAKATYTTTCVCAECPQCEMLVMGDDDACYECGSEMTPSDYCYDCQDGMFDAVVYLYEEWLARHEKPAYVTVTGEAMGWLREGGVIVVKAEPQEVLRRLSMDSEYTLYATLADEKFWIRRTSHDEPTGAWFYFEPTPVCEACDEPIEPDDADALTDIPKPWCGSCVMDGSTWSCVGCGAVSDNEWCDDCDELGSCFICCETVYDDATLETDSAVCYACAEAFREGSLGHPVDPHVAENLIASGWAPAEKSA